MFSRNHIAVVHGQLPTRVANHAAKQLNKIRVDVDIWIGLRAIHKHLVSASINTRRSNMPDRASACICACFKCGPWVGSLAHGQLWRLLSLPDPTACSHPKCGERECRIKRINCCCSIDTPSSGCRHSPWNPWVLAATLAALACAQPAYTVHLPCTKCP